MVKSSAINQLSNCKSKKDYIKHIRGMVNAIDPEYKGAGEDEKKKRRYDTCDIEAKNEAFNRKISSQIDQELKEYVQDFRAKVRSFKLFIYGLLVTYC